MKSALTIILTGLLFSVFAQPEFTPDSIKKICKRVVDPRMRGTMGNGWQGGTYYEGVMAMYYMTKERKYLDTTIAWGKYHNWLSSSGDTAPTNSDNVGCYQAYLEAYMQDPVPANAAWIAAPMVYVRKNTYEIQPSWPIVDQYHMSAANFVRGAKVSGDSVILDSLYKFCRVLAARHWNAKDSLFNSNCSDTTRPRASYWGRGCGWGVMAQCRILQMLPRGHYSAPFYQDRLHAVLYRLLRVQNQTDGMWRSDLLNQPTWNKEASCTGFFAFGYFYAIRNAIIDSATYIGPAKKAWKGLLDCIGADPGQPNRIGWSQGVGGSASNNFDETNHDDYTEGGFFLAGNEFYRLITEGIDHGATAVINPSQVSAGTSPLSHSVTRIACPAGGNMTIPVPKNATGIEIYSCSGKRLYKQENLIARSNVTLPARIKETRGMLIVKFY